MSRRSRTVPHTAATLISFPPRSVRAPADLTAIARRSGTISQRSHNNPTPIARRICTSRINVAPIHLHIDLTSTSHRSGSGHLALIRSLIFQNCSSNCRCCWRWRCRRRYCFCFVIVLILGVALAAPVTAQPQSGMKTYAGGTGTFALGNIPIFMCRKIILRHSPAQLPPSRVKSHRITFKRLNELPRGWRPSVNSSTFQLGRTELLVSFILVAQFLRTKIPTTAKDQRRFF